MALVGVKVEVKPLKLKDGSVVVGLNVVDENGHSNFIGLPVEGSETIGRNIISVSRRLKHDEDKSKA